MTASTPTARYGTATAAAWNRLHPQLQHQDGWKHHHGELPLIEGTLIRLAVDHLPRDRGPKPVWLWASATGLAAAEVTLCWQA